jgi:alkaline phosphatase
VDQIQFFLLGDGMGTQEITAARARRIAPTTTPHTASTGSSWATGQKTLDERISQRPSSAIGVPGTNLKTLLGFSAAPATPPSRRRRASHTGTVVPVWAKGPGSLGVLGTNDHTDLFDTLQGN